jgi:hypothetical protein
VCSSDLGNLYFTLQFSQHHTLGKLQFLNGYSISVPGLSSPRRRRF